MVDDGGGGKDFPVVFFDGESEINMGSVRVYPSLEFKIFQSGLSQSIGISPNQITIYLVDRKKPKLSTAETSRKIPITGKVNFAAIAKETDCFFLVVLKRTRKNRRAKPKPKQFVGDFFPPPEKLFLLRRNPSEMEGYTERLQNLQIQRENYAMMMMMSTKSKVIPRIEEGFGGSPATAAGDRGFCEECAAAAASWNGIKAPFHRCVFDTVTVGFRSPAGPIAPPPRKAHP